MMNISDYDERQLKLMLTTLMSYENNNIALSSLVGSLEFLLNALESVNEDWEEKFLIEITTLETINALSINQEAGEYAPTLEQSKKEFLLRQSTHNLKKIIEEKLNNSNEEC